MKRHVWFVTSIATFCLTFLSKVGYLIRTINLRQSVTHLATNQTCACDQFSNDVSRVGADHFSGLGGLIFYLVPVTS
jgi:hypothetical protein